MSMADEYWHNVAMRDEMEHSFFDWVMESDARLQAAYDWYKGYDNDALHELVVDYLDEKFVPQEVYTTFEGDDGFGVRDKETNELLFVSEESSEVNDWIDDNINTWNDETYDMWYDAAKKSINELGYYQFQDEEEELEESSKNLNSFSKLKALMYTLMKYLDENNISYRDVSFEDVYDIWGKIFVTIDGDWKHDHLYADYMIEEWFNKNNVKFIEGGTQVLDDTGSDWYKGKHEYRIILSSVDYDLIEDAYKDSVEYKDSLKESLLQEIHDGHMYLLSQGFTDEQIDKFCELTKSTLSELLYSEDWFNAFEKWTKTGELPKNLKLLGENAKITESVYTENGYKNRKDYLMSLADEYGVDVNTVLELASILGPSEDFDALVTEIEDLSDYADSDYIGDERDYDYESKKISEDTVKKSNGKWTNRGDDGKEHGEFKTKKEADKQRKAMYANGYTNESRRNNMSITIKESMDSSAPSFRAFVTNLGKYNEGQLVGEWVTFPIDEDDFDEVLKRIQIGDTDDFGAPYEEWFVTDYDCDLDGFDWQELGEYPSYDSLQEYGELIESIDDVEAVENAYEVTGDLREAIEGIDDGRIIYYPGCNTEEELGEYVINEIYGGEITHDLAEQYFDYDMLGRDLGFDDYENPDYDPDDEDSEEYISAGEYWCGDEYASDSDIGAAYVDAVGFDGVSNIENYFDYEAFGRDLTFESFTLTKDGAIEYT